MGTTPPTNGAKLAPRSAFDPRMIYLSGRFHHNTLKSMAGQTRSTWQPCLIGEIPKGIHTIRRLHNIGTTDARR